MGSRHVGSADADISGIGLAGFEDQTSNVALVGRLNPDARRVTTEPDFLAGRPRVLYQEATARGAQSIRGYGIALDGRFLKVAVDPALVNELLQREPIPPQPRTHVHVVQNWFDELQRLVPSP